MDDKQLNRCNAILGVSCGLYLGAHLSGFEVFSLVHPLVLIFFGGVVIGVIYCAAQSRDDDL